jgi:hypothetical protein
MLYDQDESFENSHETLKDHDHGPPVHESSDFMPAYSGFFGNDIAAIR